jgi:hypothetical protein
MIAVGTFEDELSDLKRATITAHLSMVIPIFPSAMSYHHTSKRYREITDMEFILFDKNPQEESCT